MAASSASPACSRAASRSSTIIDWFERQLTKLQVKVLYNTLLDADEIKAFGADEVIIATGSQPDGAGFQRALPEHDRLPGIERGNVWAVEDVMNRSARLGKRVIVLDETANWKGAGTAHPSCRERP